MNASRDILLAVMLVFCTSGAAVAGAVALVEDGQARCCVVVAPEAAFKELPAFNWAPNDTLLKWAADDVATYLGRMSGATVQVVDKPLDGLLPIYVGCAPEELKLTKSTEFGDAYLIDVSEKRIILHGESRRAVCYAAADLLHRLGVRWYAPGELGEVIPSRKTIRIETGRTESAPDFVTRAIWVSGPEQKRWAYRNRLGDPAPSLNAHQGSHGWNAGLPGWAELEKGRAAHPEYYNLFDGKTSWLCNLANPDVAAIWGKMGLKFLADNARTGVPNPTQLSASPDDGYWIDERPEVLAMTSGEPDPIVRLPSFSDAWFTFLNRVCAEMDKQAPGTKFTLASLAFRNYIVPPKKEKPDPRIIPIIAPMNFNHYTSLGTPGAPTSELLLDVVKGWTALSPRVGMYLHNFNPNDTAMPYTRRVHWTRDFPRLYALGVKDISIESHPNWHTMVPANYVAARLLWDVKTDVASLLDEYYPVYYGPAAESMRRYDTALEQAYETTKAFAGGVWGMHRILTPEVMKTLDETLAQAEKQVKGRGGYEQRVEIMRFSLNFATIWFAARDALNRSDLAEAEKQGAAFVAHARAANAKYPLFFIPNLQWSPNIETYFELLHNRSFKDAGRIAREGTVVYRLPDEWLAHLEVHESGTTPVIKMPDLDRGEWRPLKTYSASLDEQGLTFFRGIIWYQHRFEVPPQAREAKSLKLWLGGVTRITHAYLNGQYLGVQKVRNFGPVEFDITDAVQREGLNRLVVASDDTYPTEMGTGGIVRPALIYAPKEQK